MTTDEWESLCDGCGKCCLHKLEDEESGEVYYTDIACQLLDLESCRCQDYVNRKQKVMDCLSLSPDNVNDIGWLPSTCAYRLLAQGDVLEDWHPLLSGDSDSVHKAGISVKGRVLSETYIHPDEYEERVIQWVT